MTKRRYAQDFSGESQTQQQFKESSDVNNIVRHFEHTGFDPHADRKSRIRFGYATSTDFAEAMRNVAEIQSAFAELPSDERASHANSAENWLQSMETPTPDPIADPAPSEAPETVPSPVSEPDAAPE